MKKQFRSYIFILVLLSSAKCFGQSGQWVWMKGDTTYNNWFYAPIVGVEDSSYYPPSLYRANYWQDDSGRFWIQGGMRYDPDYFQVPQYFDYIWRFSPATNNWALIRVSPYVNSFGEYGTQGVPDSANYPGARGGSMIWKDHDGNIWLFGGTSKLGGQNDMWKYDMNSNVWTWVKGYTSFNHNGHYGIKGIEASTNLPPCRREAAAWQDTAGNFWIFGGYYESSIEDDFYNDLWRFNPSTNNWTWMGGSKFPNQPGTYGIKGLPNSNNIPPAHSTTCYWSDDHGNFFMFGGDSLVPTEYNYSQVWQYNYITNEWTWLSGPKETNVPGVSGTTCISDSNNFPTPRVESSCIKIDSERVLIFGGFRKSSFSYAGIARDVWIYKFKINEWMKIWGDSLTFSGHFGTQGIPDSSNDPRGRMGASIWKSADGNIWIYGGQRCNGECALSDLWKYTPDPNCGGIPTSNITSKNLTEATLYPNPAHNSFQLTLPYSNLENTSLTIYNLFGEKVFQQKLSAENEIQVDISRFAAGVYVVEINSSQQHWVAKLLKA